MIAVPAEATPRRSTRAPHARVPTLTPTPDKPAAQDDGTYGLASANCAVLPYPHHAGMSRVLVQACSVGTPVVAHHFGLLGHLVRTHGLGLSVDCTDPRALREAVLTLADPTQPAAHAEALRAFARYTPDRFAPHCHPASAWPQRSYATSADGCLPTRLRRVPKAMPHISTSACCWCGGRAAWSA
jgi:Glycosyl transferases group 1